MVYPPLEAEHGSLLTLMGRQCELPMFVWLQARRGPLKSALNIFPPIRSDMLMWLKRGLLLPHGHVCRKTVLLHQVAIVLNWRPAQETEAESYHTTLELSRQTP